MRLKEEFIRLNEKLREFKKNNPERSWLIDRIRYRLLEEYSAGPNKVTLAYIQGRKLVS